MAGFWKRCLLLWDSFHNSIFSNCSVHFVCMGLVTIMLKIFKLCLCSSKMNNLLSLLYLHLENLLRAISFWHSKCWTKQACLWCKVLRERLQYVRKHTPIEAITVPAQNSNKWAGRCHYGHRRHRGPNFTIHHKRRPLHFQSSWVPLSYNKSRLQTPKGYCDSKEWLQQYCAP